MNRKQDWMVMLMSVLCVTAASAQDAFRTGVPDSVKARRSTLDVAAQGVPARAAPAVPQRAQRHAAVPGSCEYSQAALCYNYAAGSSVYKPSRKLMPDLPGMQRESVSLRRDRITFRYSFK